MEIPSSLQRRRLLPRKIHIKEAVAIVRLPNYPIYCADSTEYDDPSEKVQSARLSVASRLSSSSNDHPCSSKNGTHITNGNGVAFHDVREADREFFIHFEKNTSFRSNKWRYFSFGEPEYRGLSTGRVKKFQNSKRNNVFSRATLEELISLGCRIAEEARTANYMDDYLVQLVEVQFWSFFSLFHSLIQKNRVRL